MSVPLPLKRFGCGCFFVVLGLILLLALVAFICTLMYGQASPAEAQKWKERDLRAQAEEQAAQAAKRLAQSPPVLETPDPPERLRERFVATIDGHHQDLARAVADQRWSDAQRLGVEFAQNGQTGYQDVATLVQAADAGLAAEKAAATKAKADAEAAAQAAKLEEATAAAKARQDRLDGAMARMRSTYDDMQRTTFLYAASAPQVGSRQDFITFYIGRPDHGRPFLRMELHTSGDSLLSPSQVQVRVGDTDYLFGRKARDWRNLHDASHTWEWLDIELGKDGQAVLAGLVAGQAVKLRFQGHNRVVDLTVDPAMRQSVIDVQELWRLLEL